MPRIALGALIATTLLVSVTAAGRPEDQRANVREACRQAVAGGYLKVYDERERLKAYMRALAAQIDTAEAALKEAQASLDQLNARVAASAFDVALSAEQEASRSTIKTLTAQRDEYRKLSRDAADQLDARVAEEKTLKLAIEKVFRFERMEDKPDGGHPVYLSYRASCPKYRHLCPLPAADIPNLLEIKIEGETPIACRRYASLSGIPK